MNTILLQKILDILRECLAHVGNFFKDLFVSDPQDGQVIGYDADARKWKNMSIAEIALDITDTAGPDDIITFSDAAAMTLKSLIANINVEGGTDTLNITHTGKNLALAKIDNCYIDNVGKIVSSSSYFMAVAPVKSGVTYKVNSPTLICGFFTSMPELNSVSYNETRILQTNTAFTAPIDGYVACRFDSNVTQYQIELGETTTSYEPYNGTSETITLPASVANGYVDIISGAGMNTDTSTPFTVTPVKIESTTGINNIFADTGDVTAIYYTKAAGDIKSLVSITDDITSEVTKNTTDFSDILLKVSRNNKVVSIEIYNATTAEAVNDTFLSNLPKPAMNCPVMFINKTVGEDGIFYGSLSTSGALNITVPGAKSFGGLITYVAK